MTTYHVWREHSLLYKRPEWTYHAVLAGNVLKGGPNPLNAGCVHPSDDELRPATIADFEAFRVCHRGHLTTA